MITAFDEPIYKTIIAKEKAVCTAIPKVMPLPFFFQNDNGDKAIDLS